MTEDEMVGWHGQLDGPKFEQAPGADERQGSLGCCSPQGKRFRHNWVTELTMLYIRLIKRVNPKSSHHKEKKIHSISVFSLFI